MLTEVPKNWKCYVCGKTITGRLFLMSASKSSDRVFLACDAPCVRTTEDMYFLEVSKNDMRI